MRRKPNPIKTHHAGIVHLDSSHNSSSVTQSVGSKRETMADHEDHVEGISVNQVSGEQSAFVFPIVDPNTMAQMKNIPPLALRHFHVNFMKILTLFYSSLIFCVEVMIIQLMLRS